MYFKDYLKSLLVEAHVDELDIAFTPTDALANKTLSYNVQFSSFEKGRLLRYFRLVPAIPLSVLASAPTNVLLEFQGHVLDIAKQVENEFVFPAFSNYPFPLYELKDNNEFKIHVVFSEVPDKYDFLLRGEGSIPANLCMIDKIPQEWGFSLEPSWNEMKLKLEKKMGKVIIALSPGWVKVKYCIDFFQKSDKSSDKDAMSEDKESGDEKGDEKSDEKGDERDEFDGYIPNMMLSSELNTAKYLGIFPFDDNEKMHLYNQWRSIRYNLKKEIES